MRERTILHSDMNNFYASVECMLNPAISGYPVAVGGDEDNRHGIVLAKNYKAKAYGITTGEPLWQARQKCRDLVVVLPHYEEYLEFSRRARRIYEDYTDMVEPYGMDECWLDVTGSTMLMGSGEHIANEIRERIKRELGVTVSLGVSFNKVFAKLGSDMKKPDAVTVIGQDDFREKIWGLPASDLLGVGRATAKVIERYGIRTIGDLANTPPSLISYKLGKNGETIIRYAGGGDTSPVTPCDYEPEVKSVGHGITTRADLENGEEVWNVMLSLTQDIGHKLRVYGKDAAGVAIDIRGSDLRHKQWQTRLEYPTHSPHELARAAYELFLRNHVWTVPIRSVTVRAIDLCSKNTPRQISLFCDEESHEKRERLESAVEDIRAKFGKCAIMPATLCRDIKMPTDRDTELIMPTGMLG